MADKITGDGMKIPRHVAIILDGNGRWAKSKRMPRNYGHVQGSKNVEKITELAAKMGIEYLTVYAFSTENWKRPKEEVDAIMKLLRNYLKDCIKTSKKNNMCVRVIGDLEGLDEDIVAHIKELEESSKNNTGIHFQVALNYGSRDEMIRAMKQMFQQMEEKQLSVDTITPELFSSFLDTKGIPDPDLLIRTSGEQRLSNYLLWQMAYTEFYFTDVYWPDFTGEELQKAIRYYNNRERRFGGI